MAVGGHSNYFEKVQIFTIFYKRLEQKIMFLNLAPSVSPSPHEALLVYSSCESFGLTESVQEGREWLQVLSPHHGTLSLKKLHFSYETIQPGTALLPTVLHETRHQDGVVLWVHEITHTRHGKQGERSYGYELQHFLSGQPATHLKSKGQSTWCQSPSGILQKTKFNSYTGFLKCIFIFNLQVLNIYYVNTKIKLIILISYPPYLS